MFPTVDINKEKYYYHAAKRFMMDAQMLRCRAAIHVEDKDDILFWSKIFNHFRPRDRFHFIAGSRNERGNETKGVTQCLKYLKFLGPKFFICIDSDYRYLLQEREMSIKHFVFQTYTYSFENHHCYGKGLNEICQRITTLPNTIFDFDRFIKAFSRIIYELFLWHLYFLVADPKRFPISEFNELITPRWRGPHPDIRHNAQRLLQELQQRIRQKTNYLHRKYPTADLDMLKEKYENLGLVTENTYFFVRGHNVYDLIYSLHKEVCKKILRSARESSGKEISKINLFGYRNSIDEQLKKNLHFGAYPAILKIEEDIRSFFNEVYQT